MRKKLHSHQYSPTLVLIDNTYKKLHANVKFYLFVSGLPNYVRLEKDSSHHIYVGKKVKK